MTKSIVFVHGLGLGEWVFEEHFVPHYRAQGYEVHTFNLPGHTSGSTAVERQRVTLDVCVQFVQDYLEAKLSQPYVLVGMSMGGAICQKLLASGYAHKNFSGVVLLSPVPPVNNLLFTLRLCRKLAVSEAGVLVDFFSEKPNSLLMFSRESLLRFSTEQTESYVRKILTGFSRLEYSVFFQDLVPKPFQVNLPLKIIGGEDDLLFSPEVLHFTAAYYSLQAEILPGLGHMMPVEPAYGRCIDAIDSFLSEAFS